MKNEALKNALEQAVIDSNEVRIKEVMQSVGISHVAANDLAVMCKNIIRNHPGYRIVKFIEPGQNPKTASLQECGVLICCEYENMTTAVRSAINEQRNTNPALPYQ